MNGIFSPVTSLCKCVHSKLLEFSIFLLVIVRHFCNSCTLQESDSVGFCNGKCMNHFTVQTALCKSEHDRSIEFTVLLLVIYSPYEIISMMGKTVQNMRLNQNLSRKLVIHVSNKSPSNKWKMYQ